MSLERKMNNKQLLDALDHIDDRFVAELVTSIKPPETAEGGTMQKKNIIRSIKYAALLAACAVLMGAAIPLASSLIGRISLGTGTQSGNPAGSSGEYAPLNSESNSEAVENDKDPLKAQTGDAFDGTPYFRMRKIGEDRSMTYEIFNVKGEKIDLCGCNSNPCVCVEYSRWLCFGNMICVMEEEHFGYTTFFVYDVSDPNNIKHTKVTVEGLSYDTHEIYALPNTPYFCAHLKVNNSVNHGLIDNLIVLDLSKAFEGKIIRRDYPSYKYSVDKLDRETMLLYIDGEEVYFGIQDKETVGITEIARALPGEKTTTTLFDVTNTRHFGIRTHFMIEDNGTIHFFREEMDDLSAYGYSLYHYIWREGEKVEKVLRATNICDYILADGYIYYAVNDPKYSRDFLNHDVSYHLFTDMTGGIIYRLPAAELGYEPMVAWTLGEEYYLYGVTEKNPSHGILHGISSVPIFVQGMDGGISLWANKQVSENIIMHVNLLIGDTGKEIVMSELAGSGFWGYWSISDVGGGININWEYKPE